MLIRRSIEYEITPQTVDVGETWLTMRLKNLRDVDLTNLDVRLNSLDTLGLEVRHGSTFVPRLKPQEETILYFKIAAFLTTPVYISLEGYEGEKLFYWESPNMRIAITTDKAELISLFAERKPHMVVGDTISTQTVLRSKQPSQGLRIETWTEAPDGTIDELEIFTTDKMDPDEFKEYTTEFSPTMTGIYRVHAELFDGPRRVDHKIDYVLVEEA